ncbi:hypothetical protein ACFWY9_30545 [Amycolatopsis sp. NPDC059027]|uniref:hypothetical protein n=1 Tax=Amycolatopsis sp. NPDC059027 TaxID=3346709 RepID=UPI00366E2672
MAEASFLTRQHGPLPMWAWIAGASVLAVTVAVTRDRRAAAPNAANGSRRRSNSGNRAAPNVYYLPDYPNPLIITVNRQPGAGDSTGQGAPPPGPPPTAPAPRVVPSGLDHTLSSLATHFGVELGAVTPPAAVVNPNLMTPGGDGW